MRSTKTVHVISAHAEGEVGDVIVGGVAPPPGETLWEQSRFIARNKTLRHFMLNEPRGGVFRHVNLLVPPKNPAANRWARRPKAIPPATPETPVATMTMPTPPGHHRACR